MDDSVIQEQVDNFDKIGKYNENKVQQQKSNQENIQDLDQQQQVDVKPSQVNVQKIDVIVNTKLENYSGKIEGVLYSRNQPELIEKLEIDLYFGATSDFPVYKTNTDKQGKYCIEDLPPGFYSIRVMYRNSVVGRAYNIKVLPGQSSSHFLYLDE